jgi:hypothetical protein
MLADCFVMRAAALEGGAMASVGRWLPPWLGCVFECNIYTTSVLNGTLRIFGCIKLDNHYFDGCQATPVLPLDLAGPAHDSAPWPLLSSIHIHHQRSKFSTKQWAESVLCGPDQSEDPLKRCITTAPSSITTIHHGGGLPSQLSYTLVDNYPPLSSTPTQPSKAKFKGKAPILKRLLTKWEAVQLADQLEAKQAMAKANWVCWKKLEERVKQIHRPFLLDLDDDVQEDASQDKRIKQRWNVELLQHGQEMDISPYSPSPSPQQ